MDIYEKYHSNRRLFRRTPNLNNFTYNRLFNLLDKYISKKKTSLDIGCGVGTISAYLASRGMLVKGVDISENAIMVARQNARNLGLDKLSEFKKMNFPSVKPNEKFDLVVCSEVLEHLKYDRRAISVVYSLLKRNGFLVITAPSLNAPLYRLGMLKGFDKKVGHIRRYRKGKLINMLRNAGFSIIESGKWEGILRNFIFTNRLAGFFIKFLRGPVANFFTFIDDLTIPIFGESDVYIIAKK